VAADLVYGLHPVREALRGRREVLRVWCSERVRDSNAWVPEAARLLRPGGRLTFLTNSFLLMLCMPAEDGVAAADRLLRPAFGMYRVEWPGDAGVEFHLSHGDWLRLLRRSGFDVEDLVEVRPDADTITRYPFVSLDWARRWPCEEVWKARKRE